MKCCINCKQIKPLNKFGYDKRRNTYSTVCNKCRYEQSKKRHLLKCKQCGKDFRTNRKTASFCSVKCRCESKKKAKLKVKCAYCGEYFERLESQFNGKNYKFCSVECKNKGESLFYSGINSHSYNHNKSLEDRLKERKYIEYYEWREEVYKRDNHTCQCCKDNKGGNLVAHHILNYSEYEELRTNIDNGITLCKTCHKNFHDIYGYKNNTLEQLNDFLLKQNKVF